MGFQRGALGFWGLGFRVFRAAERQPRFRVLGPPGGFKGHLVLIRQWNISYTECIQNRFYIGNHQAPYKGVSKTSFGSSGLGLTKGRWESAKQKGTLKSFLWGKLLGFVGLFRINPKP